MKPRVAFAMFSKKRVYEKVFVLPVQNLGEAEAEMNAFLRGATTGGRRSFDLPNLSTIRQRFLVPP